MLAAVQRTSGALGEENDAEEKDEPTLPGADDRRTAQSNSEADCPRQKAAAISQDGVRA